MEYVRFGEDYEKLEKEGKYTEALDALVDEIAYNLANYHNKHSDLKITYKRLKNTFGFEYGKNSNGTVIEGLNVARDICEWFCIYLGYEEFRIERVEKEDYLYIKKKMVKLIKRIKKEV